MDSSSKHDQRPGDPGRNQGEYMHRLGRELPKELPMRAMSCDCPSDGEFIYHRKDCTRKEPTAMTTDVFEPESAVTSDTMPQCIQNWIDAQDEKVARAKALAPIAVAAQQACDLAGVGQVFFSDILFRIHITILNAESLDECLPVLRELAKLGYHTNKGMPFVDHPDLDFRSYKVGDIDVDVHLKLTGATCRKVQVGVKEEPVYEFVCD